VKQSNLSTPALYLYFVGFKDLTAVAMKITGFWDITPCSPFKVTDISEEYIESIFRIEK
jgi:hypothetical protein